jgi:NAD(P)-dependent dehydrogenase (short-subunit alcohol dehydrogenase family)
MDTGDTRRERLPNAILDFSRKVVLVTGGGSGLGRGIGYRFAEAGADIVVNYLHSAGSAAELSSQVAALGGKALTVQADVTKKSGVETLIAKTMDVFGRLDVLINNAGIYPLSPVIEMAEEEWDQVVNANLRSTFLCTQAAAKQMIEQETGGAVVNIASIEALNPAPMHSHYNAAKGGVLMYTKAAANELGPYGIRVNAVSPGLIWREGLELDWPEGIARYQKAAPLKRLGMPDDVADACLFLASTGARWITGANLVVDGGVMTNQIF